MPSHFATWVIPRMHRESPHQQLPTKNIAWEFFVPNFYNSFSKFKPTETVSFRTKTRPTWHHLMSEKQGSKECSFFLSVQSYSFLTFQHWIIRIHISMLSSNQLSHTALTFGQPHLRKTWTTFLHYRKDTEPCSLPLFNMLNSLPFYQNA